MVKPDRSRWTRGSLEGVVVRLLRRDDFPRATNAFVLGAIAQHVIELAMSDNEADWRGWRIGCRWSPAPADVPRLGRVSWQLQRLRGDSTRPWTVEVDVLGYLEQNADTLLLLPLVQLACSKELRELRRRWLVVTEETDHELDTKTHGARTNGWRVLL